jgi:cell division protein FtsL
MVIIFLTYERYSFNNSIAILSEQIKSLKRQEENIKAVVETLTVDHQQHLQLLAFNV